MQPRKANAGPGLTQIGSLLPSIETMQDRSDTMKRQSTNSLKTSASTGLTAKAATEPTPTGATAGENGAVTTGDAPDPRQQPDKVEDHLHRIRDGLPASLVRHLESNERLMFPNDGEPYSAERGLFEPPQISNASAGLLREAWDKIDLYIRPAERRWILGRVLALLAHYFTPNTDPRVAEAIAEDWAQDLRDFPDWAILEACSSWRREETQRRPTPGHIRNLCQKRVAPHVRLARKIKLTLAQHSQGGKPERTGLGPDMVGAQSPKLPNQSKS